MAGYPDTPDIRPNPRLHTNFDGKMCNQTMWLRLPYTVIQIHTKEIYRVFSYIIIYKVLTGKLVLYSGLKAVKQQSES